jgi:hypothetical protein
VFKLRNMQEQQAEGRDTWEMGSKRRLQGASKRRGNRNALAFSRTLAGTGGRKKRETGAECTLTPVELNDRWLPDLAHSVYPFQYCPGFSSSIQLPRQKKVNSGIEIRLKKGGESEDLCDLVDTAWPGASLTSLSDVCQGRAAYVANRSTEEILKIIQTGIILHKRRRVRAL